MGLKPIIVAGVLAIVCTTGCRVGKTTTQDEHRRAQPKVQEAWRPLAGAKTAGVLGERLSIWRKGRLWRDIDDPYLLSGFESRPGVHPWQGDHLGKWLHAATLAYENTGDEILLQRMQDTVRRLLRTQEANGYMGTYSPEKRFYAPPDEFTKKSWDVWTHRYNLYGLLFYERYHPDPEVVRACIRMGDLLLETYGPGKRDITQIGTKDGISATVLLESIMMLYARTGEERFLRFAEQIVKSSEENPKLRLMSAMLAGEDVSGPGLGKAYQLMANLLGYGELYRYTGRSEYLQAAVKGWENIRQHHIFETGGPWGYAAREGQNKECFAPESFYDPSNDVETCSTTTWIQLSHQLLSLTGEAKYAVEAERALLNHLLGAQAPNGTDWSYYTAPNCSRRAYKNNITCCSSSGPRALEVFAQHMVGTMDGALAIKSYAPFSLKLPEGTSPVRKISVEGRYPMEDRATIRLDLAAPVETNLALPMPVGTRSIKASINGQPQALQQTGTAFLRMARKWAPGDVLELEFDMPVQAHVHSGRDNKKWISFTRGPLALAEDVRAGKQSEPPLLAIPSRPADAATWLEPAKSTLYAGVPAYRIRKTGTILVPYYLAGSTGNGVRTIFPVQ